MLSPLPELQKIFHDADDDSSGSIDKKEFKKLVKKLNIFPGEKEFETMFRECDQDGKGLHWQIYRFQQTWSACYESRQISC